MCEERGAGFASSVSSLADLNDKDYDECLARVDRWVKDHPSLVLKHGLQKGRGPASHAARPQSQSAGSRAVAEVEIVEDGKHAEDYNGSEGGRIFKWYTPRVMALVSLNRFGKQPTDLQEREWMEVLHAVNETVRMQDAIATACVEEYAGPQCYAHRFDLARLRANAPVASSGACVGVGETESVAALGRCWLKCDAPRCGRVRCLSSRALGALSQQTYLKTQRGSALNVDWGEWLQDAGFRWDQFVEAQTLAGALGSGGGAVACGEGEWDAEEQEMDADGEELSGLEDEDDADQAAVGAEAEGEGDAFAAGVIADDLLSRSQGRNRAGERARVRFTCDMLQRPADGGDWRCRACTDTDDWDELTQTTWSIADVSVGDRLLLMRPASRAWPADDEYGRFATVIAVEPASADAASREAALAAADASLRRMPL